MSFLALLLAWTAAPLVELVIIIVLYLDKRSNEKKIEELFRQLQDAKQEGRPAYPLPLAWQEGPQPEGQDVFEGGLDPEKDTLGEEEGTAQAPPFLQEKQEGAEVWGPQPEVALIYERQESDACLLTPHMPKPDEKKPGKESAMAMAALVIGVVFVVLSGLIFATTAWHILPNIGKVLLVGMASLVFFAASFLAGKRLYIYRTGNAFYLLGSVFLFFTVLAAGYFEVLGPEFILEGVNRWRVLLAGGLVTVAMMFLGLKQFHHGFYTQACFWGLTVNLFYLMAACEAEAAQFASGMMVYGFLLVAGEFACKKARKRKVPKEGDAPADGRRQETDCGGPSFFGLLEEGFGCFAVFHFWVAAAFMSLAGILGVLSLPGLEPGWHGAIAMGAMAAGAAVLALRRGNQGTRCFFSFAVALGIHYTMMWISREIFAYMGEPVYWGPWKLCVAVFSAQVLVALCFWMGRKGKFPFRTGAGDRVYTAFMGIDVFALGMVALIVWLIRQNRYPLYLLVAAGGILIFAVVVALWAREYQGLRRILPFLYLFVVLLLHGSFAGGGWVTDEWIGRGAFRAWLDKGLPEFLLLAALAIQDRKKPRGYGAPLLAIGTIAQMVCFSQREISLPFFFLLSAYLLARSGLKAGAGLKRGGRGKNGGPWFFLEENPYVYGACAYCLMGVYVFMCPFTLSYTVFRMMAVDGAYVAWLAAVKAGWGKGRKSRPLYWDVAGCVLLAGTMAGYYLKAGDLAGYNLGPVWETGDVALRLAAFAGFYRMFYRGKRSWPHLLAAAFVFPLPFALCYGHDWTQGQFYLFVLAAYGFTGIVARRRHLICEKAQEVDLGWRVDWHHVLALLLLAPMALYSQGNWQFACLLWISAYFLQFFMVEPWRRPAGVAAAAALVLAFWCQPFVDWPPVLGLEIQLLPLALYFWGLGLAWPGPHAYREAQKGHQAREKARIRRTVQIVGYVGCLLALCADAWQTGALADALIVEGLCLVIFIGAQIAHSRLWVRISGTIIVTVALYMTKGFWLSISWWIYLLAAGIGLILFAAAKERKRRKAGEEDD